MKHKGNFLTKIAVTLLTLTFVGLGTSQPSFNEATNTVHAAKVTKKQVGSKTTLKQQNTALLQQSYNGTQTIEINDNQPTFTKANLSTANGAWQKYANLDSLNRPVVANALLNKSLMPTEKRESLTVDPTGWRNKKIKNGYLYNRSHLIGFQLTGQNNNPKNLITGTRSLNSPEMLRFEDDIAYYIKNNPKAYVRYQVTPVFKDNELLARGVHMQAESTTGSGIKFNVYIFNIQAGVQLNYADGTSQFSADQLAQSSAAATASSTTTQTESSATNDQVSTDTQGQIVGNVNSKIYHTPDQAGYNMSAANAIYFNTEAEAQAAGYRKSLR
ncbi:DNA/RNA non-specific endonuclease [Loigolactobacillus zhaoyuanensis]|uniref:DNA/RNA non-specific endonuclease n=1 Tax=Loigolactobacillus zhaoyuanensis TaxID=2486017 RepID=A0ABW8UDE0_9LACO|nr:DNA/RNA non-specific endonuclease [Loigolactobacillus zhaoyuanensis]